MLMEERLISLVEDAVSSTIQPFKFDKVRKIYDEIRSLYQMNQSDVKAVLQGSADVHCAIQDRHCTIERATRCLVASLHGRLMRLKQIRWQMGAILPAAIRDNLAEHELKWFQTYNSDLAAYMQAVDSDGFLDLTQFTEPPESLFARVKCVEDYGEFEIEDGTTYTLVKGSEHLIPRYECEVLVREGVLEFL